MLYISVMQGVAQSERQVWTGHGNVLSAAAETQKSRTEKNLSVNLVSGLMAFVWCQVLLLEGLPDWPENRSI